MILRSIACATLALGLPATFILTSQRSIVSDEVAVGTVNSDLPPERFRGESVSIVVFTDRAGIDANCGQAQPGSVIIACHRQLKESGTSVIFMPNPCYLGDAEFYAKIMCHENGHAQGWTAEHEL